MPQPGNLGDVAKPAEASGDTGSAQGTHDSGELQRHAEEHQSESLSAADAWASDDEPQPAGGESDDLSVDVARDFQETQPAMPGAINDGNDGAWRTFLSPAGYRDTTGLRSPAPIEKPDVPETVLADQPEDAAAVAFQASTKRSASRQQDDEESDFHVDLQRFAAGASGLELPDSAQTVALADVEVRNEADPVPVESEEKQLPVEDETGAASTDEPDFVRQARRRAFWQSPGMRVLLAMLALVLAALLAGQWLLHERDRLAAIHPEWSPLLARLCEPFGYELRPVRRIDAIVIDSSTLARRLGNFYSFDLVLKNTEAMALAVPALELSLTDTSDAVISRRVFMPEEMPGMPPLLPPQGTVSVSLRLSLSVGDVLPMAGYRALVFYP